MNHGAGQVKETERGCGLNESIKATGVGGISDALCDREVAQQCKEAGTGVTWTLMLPSSSVDRELEQTEVRENSDINVALGGGKR